ncbi:sensor histidine kinase [Brevibacillus sp. H7]|uniref:sensor histidine kinase n=1 Tax=Brevibacillus sp. H7 TaxID=3349138 RepID=UPI0037FD1D3D
MDLLLNFILIDVPEAFIVLALGLAVFNVSILPMLKRGLLFSVLFGIGSFLLTTFQVTYEFKILALFTYMNLLVTLLFQKRALQTVIISASSFGCIMLAESFIITFFNLFSINLEQILNNRLYLYSAVWLYLLTLLGLTYVLRRNRFDLQKLLPETKTNQYLSMLIVVGAIEFLLILTISTRLFLAKSNSMDMFLLENVPLLLWLILALFIIMIWLFRVYLQLTIHRVEAETETPYLQNIQDLVTAIRSIKHDAVNHYTAIDGFLKKKMYDHATDYVKMLLEEATNIVQVVEGVNSPAVSALLHSKMAICVANHISFSIEIESESQFSFIKTNDFIKVLGNLLDNAIRATLHEPDSNRYIRLQWTQDNQVESLIIENSGPTIPPDKLEEIFDLRYTTKTNGEGGVGLAVVKKVISKYNGNIYVESKDGVTRFRIVFSI